MNLESFYITPQITFIENWFGFQISSYWGDNDVARYINFSLGFINLSISITVGVRK